MAKLTIRGNDENRDVELAETSLVIGRGKDNEVVITDPRSSRKHCRLSRTPQGWVLEDLKSRNGLLLNGSQVEREFLKDGDEFQVGSTRFHFIDSMEDDGAEKRPGDEAKARAATGAPKEAEERPEEKAEAEAASGAETVLSARNGEAPRAPEDRSTKNAETTEKTANAEKSRQPAGGEFYLEGTDGAYTGKRIQITHLPFTVGRKRGSDFKIDDTRASSRHATIVEREGHFIIEDAESTNGTFINRKRIREGALTPGAILRIGDSQFRVQLPADAVPPAPPELLVAADGEPALEDDDFSHFDARAFLSQAPRTETPLAVLVILVLLAGALYLTVDFTVKMIRRIDPDPVREGNLVILNWSLEDRKNDNGISGWAPHEGDEVDIELASQGAQYPGVMALRLSPRGEGLHRAVSTRDILVDEDKDYRISAHVLNQGAFTSGILISWLNLNTDEVGRDWGTGINLENQPEHLDRVVVPHPDAVFARLMPFVIAWGGGQGGATFDQIDFRPVSPDEREKMESESYEESDWDLLPWEISTTSLALSASRDPSRKQPIELLVEVDGSIRNVLRGSKPVIKACWLGFSPERDPLLLGHRLSTIAREADERDGVLLSGQIPDSRNGRWYPLETRIAAQGEEIRCMYRFQGSQEEGGMPRRVAFYLESGSTQKNLMAFGGELMRPSSFRLDQPAEGKVDEIIFGMREEQIALLFDPPVTLSSIPHPEANGRKLLVAEVDFDSGQSRPGGRDATRATRTVTLRISPYSRKENQAVVALLALAEEEHRGGKSLEARARIEDLRNRFPWRTGDLAAADKLEESWNQEATRALGDLLSGVEDLKTSPSPVIHEALGARAAKMLSRFRGSPLEEKFEGVASEIARLLPRPGTDDEVANPELYLKQARDHLNHDRRGFSRLFLYLARGLNPDAESLKELQHLEGLLDERRKQGAERGGL